MISEWDVRKFAKRDDSWFSIDENNNVVDKETGEVVCDISVLLQVLREKLHCDFEVVYECHPLLDVILRCKQCGTVIFTTEDEDYEPNLCCPTCSDFKTGFEYWTKEEIERDEKKKETILFYEKMYAEDIEAEKRRKARGGKYDWQIGKCSFKIPGNKKVYLDLECDNLFKSKLKGLRLDVHIGEKDGDYSYVVKKFFTIPLSLSHLKIQIRIWKKRRKGEI